MWSCDICWLLWELVSVDMDWLAVLKTAEESIVERFHFSEFGDLSLEGPRNVCSDQPVSSVEVRVYTELLLKLAKLAILSQLCVDSSTAPKHD